MIFLLSLESSFGNRHGINPSVLAEAMSIYAQITDDWDGVDNSSLTARGNDRPDFSSCVYLLGKKNMDHPEWL